MQIEGFFKVDLTFNDAFEKMCIICILFQGANMQIEVNFLLSVQSRVVRVLLN